MIQNTRIPTTVIVVPGGHSARLMKSRRTATEGTTSEVLGVSEQKNNSSKGGDINENRVNFIKG